MDDRKRKDFIGDWSGSITCHSREISYGSPGKIRHWKTETRQEIDLKITVEDPLKPFIGMFGGVPVGMKVDFSQYRFEGEAVVSGTDTYEHFDVDCPLECKNRPPRSQTFPPVKVPAQMMFFDDSVDVRLGDRPPDYSRCGIGRCSRMKVTKREPEAIDFEYSQEEDDEFCIVIKFAGRLRRPEKYLKIEYAPDCSGILSNPFTRAAVLDLGEGLLADKIIVTGADRTREFHKRLIDENKTQTAYENCYHGENQVYKAADVKYYRADEPIAPSKVTAMAATMDKIGGIGTYENFNHIDIRDRLPDGKLYKWPEKK